MLSMATMAIHVLLLGSPDVAEPIRVAQADDAAEDTAKRDKIRERIRAMRAYRLTEELELDEATAAKVFPLLRGYDDKLEPLARENAKLRRKLRKLADDKAKSSEIDAALDRLVANHDKISELQQKRFRALRKVLTPVQSARMVLILPELDRSIRRELRRAMRGKRGRDGRPGRRRRWGEPQKLPF